LEAELNLDPDSNPDPYTDPESDLELITDPDPNLQIISDPAGSGCTTLHATMLHEHAIAAQYKTFEFINTVH
jgi:hypothetical protein